MASSRSLIALGWLLTLGACSLSHVMPPFSATRSYATAVTTASPPVASLPAPRAFEHRKPIGREYDQETDQTRVSVTTHRGAYFLWIQRPRLTFFYVFAGTTLRQSPPSVFLVFRTQNPQYPLNNRLAVLCDGTRRELAITPTFWLEPGVMTTSRHYMYELPLSTFAELVRCGIVSIAVGDIRAPFAHDQLEALRDFATGLRAQ